MPSPIPVILAIDLEPEAIHVERDGSSPWAGGREAFEFVNEFREYASGSGNPVPDRAAHGPADREAYCPEEHGVQLFERSSRTRKDAATRSACTLTSIAGAGDAALRMEHMKRHVERRLRESLQRTREHSCPCSVHRGGERWQQRRPGPRRESRRPVRPDAERGGSAALTISRGSAFRQLARLHEVAAVSIPASQGDFRVAGRGRAASDAALRGRATGTPARVEAKVEAAVGRCDRSPSKDESTLCAVHMPVVVPDKRISRSDSRVPR